MAPDRKDASRAAPPETASFEEALERLENIVEELEGGSLTLEDSIARYEEGVRLSKRLTQTLDEAEKRIERLVVADSGGEPSTTPLELDENSGESEPGPASRASSSRAEERSSGPRSRERMARSSYPAPEPDELPF